MVTRCMKMVILGLAGTLLGLGGTLIIVWCQKCFVTKIISQFDPYVMFWSCDDWFANFIEHIWQSIIKRPFRIIHKTAPHVLASLSIQLMKDKTFWRAAVKHHWWPVAQLQKLRIEVNLTRNRKMVDFHIVYIFAAQQGSINFGTFLSSFTWVWPFSF